jgi:predicted patatin/cPLA2 family phospholipase
VISVAMQGGAMRSIYCLGVVRALTETPYADDVTTIHASSAGCVPAAVLANHLTKANPAGVPEMTEELIARLAVRRFIDQRRLRRIVDVDYLVRVIAEVTSIDCRSLSERGLTFEVAVTDAELGSAKYIDVTRCASDADLCQALRATMAIPVLYPPRVDIDGRRYVDGGIADPLPLLRAFRQNPDVVVAISSVPQGTLDDPAEGVEARILRLVPGISPVVRHLMLTRNPLAGAVDDLSTGTLFCGARLVRISPSDPSLVGSRIEIDRRKLLALEALGYRDGLRALDELRRAQAGHGSGG